jgi:hypothetical protein
MNLIDRYVSEVSRRLWKRNRKDIEKELRSTLEDMLQEKIGDSEATEEDEIQILKEFGNPKEVAASYNTPDKFLIGPKVFDLYILVLKIVLLVVLILTLLGSGISIAFSVTESIFIELILIVPKVLSALIGAFGSVTIIFALIEHFTDEEIDLKDEEWDPRELPEEVDEFKKVSISGMIVKIILIIFALIIFNLYPDKIPVFYNVGEKWVFVPALDIEAVRTYLPYWNLLWMISLILSFFVLIKRRWDLKTKISDILLSALSIIVLAVMIKGPDIINLNELGKVNPQLAQDLIPVFNILGNMIKVLFGILIAVILFDIIKKGYKIIKDRV